jgi:type IV pilus assembly protein PilY1
VSENATWCVENVSPSTCVAPGTIQSDTSGDTTAYFCVTPNSTVCSEGELVGSDCRVPAAVACTGTMNALVGVSTDTRTIYTAKADGTALIPFDTTYRAANPTYFDATLLANLSQWPPSSDTSANANAFRAGAPGDNLLNYLRGQNGHEYNRTAVADIDEYYRNRNTVMGDALESQPAYMGPPIFNYPYKGYTQFVTANSSRVGTVYMGTNDGMMHAFAADTGIERWAYIPSMVVANMWKLADQNYADKHTNYVNGSAITSDVCTANCSNTYSASTPGSNPVWKTILVAGLNGGGRGYFALDITTPTAPTLLWEFTTNSGIGKTKDNDLGYTFGQPVITQKADGTWVVLVTSGYDNGTDSATTGSGGTLNANSPAGSGIGYLYVLNAGTGAIISKISTAVGTAANPSGLAKIAGYNSEAGGNKVSYVYGGDLLGNLWRFDINSTTSATIGTGTAFKFATLYSDGTTANTAGTTTQPIMTTPQLGNILGKRVVFIGTGKYLETADLTTTSKQTQYAIQDADATTTLVNPRTTLVQNFLINDPGGTATRLSSGSAGGGAATTANKVDFSTGRGWFVDLPDTRERVNIDAKLVLGTLVVPSIVPSNTDCAPGGTGWLNFFDYSSGGAVVTTPGVLTTSVKYDSTIVGLNVLFIDGQPVVEVVTSTQPTPQKDPNVAFKATSAGFTGKRTLWRELIP